MAYATSNMSAEELDELYEKAKANESFIIHCENLIDDAMNDKRDMFDDDMDDYATEDFSNHQWIDEDEAALEHWEENRRERLAIENEY